MTALDVPARRSRRARAVRSTLATVALRASGAAAVIALAFAAPAVLSIALVGRHAVTEARLTHAIVSAFGGVTLPVVAGAVAAIVISARGRARLEADRLVAAGLEPRRAFVGPLLAAILSAALVSAAVGVVAVVTLRVGMRLGAPSLVLSDAAGTAWAMSLGAAAWTAIAVSLVARGGRAGLGYLVVAIDLGMRLLPGGVAWLGPSSHVDNLLGAPPPRVIVSAPILPQLASVGALLVVALLFVLIAHRRYQGAPPR